MEIRAVSSEVGSSGFDFSSSNVGIRLFSACLLSLIHIVTGYPNFEARQAVIQRLYF